MKQHNTKNKIQKIQHEGIQHEKYNTHIQRDLELSSPELSTTEKGPKQQYVDIRPLPFQNDDPINAHIDKTGKSLVALQPKSPLHSVVSLISGANSLITFNLLICF